MSLSQQLASCSRLLASALARSSQVLALHGSSAATTRGFAAAAQPQPVEEGQAGGQAPPSRICSPRRAPRLTPRFPGRGALPRGGRARDASHGIKQRHPLHAGPACDALTRAARGCAGAPRRWRRRAGGAAEEGHPAARHAALPGHAGHHAAGPARGRRHAALHDGPRASGLRRGWQDGNTAQRCGARGRP